MANSKYEYVKAYEVQDKIMRGNLIIVRIDGRNFQKFSENHHFEKPNDERALILMNSCAAAVMEEYPDIVFSYGFSDEYSFVLKKKTRLYQRRESKILSLIVSIFTCLYAIQWKEFFPQQDLRCAPSFHAQVISCPGMEVLQAYLAWRQTDCHIKNQYETCFWKLVGDGKDEAEAHKYLKGTKKQEKNDILFKYGINYNNLPEIFRQGTCLLRTEIEDIVKYKGNGDPVKRIRKKLVQVHSSNIATVAFWNNHSCLLKELGRIEEERDEIMQEYWEDFQFHGKLTLSNWIVVRIDGHRFHRFSDVHEFEKPNDDRALNLMNSCASIVLEEFQDVIFGYGVSDEYSFVLRKESQLYERNASGIVSVILSLFSSAYVMKWKDFFPKKQLTYPPSFDGRAVCYASAEILRDYLSWRQVDCHINNQYNTCFWMLVMSGKSKSEAQNILKGTRTQEKNALLLDKFGIDYYTLPIMFRRGSCVYKESKGVKTDEIGGGEVVVVEHSNIIDDSFWEEHRWILGDVDGGRTRSRPLAAEVRF